jgi:hypothetical protein
MAAFDDFVPQFQRAKDRWPDAPTLAQHYIAVKESFEGSSLDIIASIKSFLECVCITILGEFGKSVSSDASTIQLLGEAMKAIGLDRGRGASKLGKLLSAHNKMADALNEMRNENDPIAHGKDGFLDILSRNECRAFIITADAILALLMAGYEGAEPDLRYTREPYERFANFHSKVNRAVSMEASVDSDQETAALVVTLKTASLPDGVEIRLEPSELLYAVDRTAYVELLASAAVPIEDPKIPWAILELAPPESPDAIVVAASAMPIVELVDSYDGCLSSLKPGFQQFLEALGGLEAAIAMSGTRLRDSLLATAERSMGLDWVSREPLNAAMKVAVKRTFTKFGVESERAGQSAERVVSWLRANAGSSGVVPTTS